MCRLDRLEHACDGEKTPRRLKMSSRVGKVRSLVLRGFLTPTGQRGVRARYKAREQLRRLAMKATRLGARGRLSPACAAAIGNAAAAAIGAI
jgi:hypothetical protein